MLKAMMEKIISQNEELDKQNNGSTATSSYAVGTSNTHMLNIPIIATKKQTILFFLDIKLFIATGMLIN